MAQSAKEGQKAPLLREIARSGHIAAMSSVWEKLCKKYLVGVGARVVLDAPLGGEVVVVARVLGYLTI